MHISKFFCTLAVDLKLTTMKKIDIGYIIKNAEEIWHAISNSSSTRGTLLHSTKLPKWKWLVAIYQVANIKNISVRELAGVIGVNKNTAWKLLQKIRYNLTQEEIKMVGEVMIDEAYIGGWVNKHLSHKWEYMRKRGYISPSAKRYTKTQILAASSDYKQHIISMVDSEGKTKLLHLPNPITKECIKYVLRRENITSLVCDESALYRGIGYAIETNNHSKHQWKTTTGKSTNTIENRFSWTKNKIRYNTHTSEKYLQLYLNQFAWQNNIKHLTKSEKFYATLRQVIFKQVTDTDLHTFNYKKDYPKSRREKEIEDLKLLQENLGELGIVTLR